MGSDANVLIVEDEDEWRKIYERAVSSQKPSQTIKVAKDLARAEALIDSTKFAVAFVDVGLDVADDHNVDGLRVMQKIRSTGDETSIVVVTGRSGQDVLPITRDAIIKYGAFDTIAKGTVAPGKIRELLLGGLEAYQKATLQKETDARDAMCGALDPIIWDSRATSAVGFKGKIRGFYDFLDRLTGAYLPLVPRLENGEARIDAQNKVVYGTYWSRAVGAGVLIGFGAADYLDGAFEAIRENAGCGVQLKEVKGQGLRGAVFELEACEREEFQPQ